MTTNQWNNPNDLVKIMKYLNLPSHPTAIASVIQAQNNLLSNNSDMIPLVQADLSTLDTIESALLSTYTDPNWSLQRAGEAEFRDTRSEGLEEYKRQLITRVNNALLIRIPTLIRDIQMGMQNTTGGQSGGMLRYR